jgi:hypothetical protein
MSDFKKMVEDELKISRDKYPGPQSYYQIYGCIKHRQNMLDNELMGMGFKSGAHKNLSRTKIAATCVQIAVLVQRFYEDNLDGEFKPSSYDTFMRREE